MYMLNRDASEEKRIIVSITCKTVHAVHEIRFMYEKTYMRSAVVLDANMLSDNALAAGIV
jgi:hypothetical protein